MKRIKKILALAIAMVMVLGMSMSVFAQEVDSQQDGPASITINNPAKGETYNVVKLFDATVSGDNIAYQGDIPDSLSEFFEKDTSGNILPKDSIAEKDNGKITGTTMTEELLTALGEWAKGENAIVSRESDGSESLVFTGLPYGYYVITRGETEAEIAKSAITVTSTQPNASIYDKNVTEPTVTKTVEHESYSIGDTVKYTATFDTTNYMGEGAASKQVVNYVITDTLPEFLSNVTVTEVKVGDTVLTPTPEFTNGSMTIAWADQGIDGKYTSKYDNGAQIVIQYQATLTSVSNTNTANTNTISITPYVDNGNGTTEPWEESWEDSAVIKTYAAAIKKVDDLGNALSGAEFTFKGLTVTGSDGVYTVVSYDPNSTIESDALKTDNEGKLYIIGLAKDVELTVTEAKAPNGYNKLTETKTLKPQVLSEVLYKASGTIYYDADGNIVSEESKSESFETVDKNLSKLDASAIEIVNNKGTLLPSTGGIGTTIFYVVGAILVLGAGVLLVTKRRMNAR